VWLPFAFVTLWSALYVLVALDGGAGYDSRAYWLTRHGLHYGLNPGQPDAYLYSPAFAHVLRPLTLLPWHVFAVIWFAGAAIAYVWLTRGAATRWRLVLLALSLGDVIYGNVWWLFALTLSLGLRRPALWAIPLLLKITPAVGIVWFVARREWRNLGIALAAAGAVVAASVAIDAQAWLDWLAFLRRHDPTPPLEAARFVAGVLLTVYAARTDRRQLLPAALWLATPVFSLNGLAVAAAIPGLVASRPASGKARAYRLARLREVAGLG
jgi:Glycosyltransferase family 87